MGVWCPATSKNSMLSSFVQTPTTMIRNSRDINYSVYNILRISLNLGAYSHSCHCLTKEETFETSPNPLSVMSSRISSTHSTYYKSNSPQRPGISGGSDSYDPAEMIPGAYPEDRHSKGHSISSINSIIFMYHFQRPTLLLSMSKCVTKLLVDSKSCSSHFS